MANVDLVFEFLPTSGAPVNLVFGDDGTAPPKPDAIVSGAITLRRPALHAVVHPTVDFNGAVVLRRPTIAGRVRYFSDTARPTVGQVGSRFQDGTTMQAGAAQSWQDGVALPAVTRVGFQDGAALETGWQHRHQDAKRLAQAVIQRFQDAAKRSGSATSRYQDGVRQRASIDSRFQDGVGLEQGAKTRYQDAWRGARKTTAERFQDGTPQSRQFVGGMKRGLALQVPGGRTRYQDAMHPPAGIWVKPGPQPQTPCYDPSADLLFSDLWSASPNLLFVCEKAGPGPEPEPGVVVPIRKVYLVVNSATLIRLSDGKVIPTSAMSLGLDADSWTWTFNASVPASIFADVAWQDGEPVTVQATVNGAAFKLMVETITRDRTFGQDALRIGGRGRIALLDAPYSPVLNLFAQETLTSQQLAEWVLQDNGVPLGWDVNWGIDAWSVPGGVFSFQGSYIGALNRIAESAGAYVQPHNTADQIIVLPRYPKAPWEWSSVTPDFALPSAVVQREGTDWANKAYYNRVYVRGEAVGVNGRVTRAGTAGDRLAPAVVDPLITAPVAARQRGISILSNVGRITTMSLRMPVLPETGIIKPGKFVRYTDGGQSRIGITRAVQVEVGLPNVWQTLSVETHDEPI